MSNMGANKGTVHRWKHEIAECKCGAKFSRTVWKGVVKKLCERCQTNRNYQLRRNR